MKQFFLSLVAFASIQSTLPANPSHLDIMVPDIQDTDLKGPVKSVELKLWENVSGEFTTEKREYDKIGNLLKITEHDEDEKLVDSSTFTYDENGCYERLLYRNEEKDYANEWKVMLNPETRQIALREIKSGHIGIETYSPEGYLINYRLMDKDRNPIVTKEYKRDEKNRRVKFTRIEGRKPAYTYYFKWADNGFIDMEAQTYHQEKEKRRHTYEYLVTDDYGNWTQRIMVRYDIGGKTPVKVYEQTVQRKIEYYEEDIEPQSEEAVAKTENETGTDDDAGEPITETSEEEEIADE